MLNDYSGDVIGVVDVAMSRDFYRYAKRKAVGLAIVSVLISLITTYVLNLSILRLRRKMVQAKEQKVQLVSWKILEGFQFYLLSEVQSK